MLSRTADHLLWMSRYIERAENTARMLDVNYQTTLLPQSASQAEQGWSGLLSICELLPEYRQRHGSIQPDRVIEVIVDADGQLRLKVDGRTPAGSDPDERVAMGRLAARVKALAEGAAQVPVIIAADKGVRYELVVKVMDTLQRAGVARVGLAVRTTGG